MNNSLTDMLNTSLVVRPDMVTSDSYWLNGLIGFLCLFLSISTVFVIVLALHSWFKSYNFKFGSVTTNTWLEKAIPEAWRAYFRNQKVPPGFQNLNLHNQIPVSLECNLQVNEPDVEQRVKKKKGQVRFWLVGRGRAYAFISYTRNSHIQTV